MEANPRAVIGGNNPPEPTAIERAEPHIEALRRFLNDNPVISTEEESRAGKAIRDNVVAVLKAVEAERDGKVRPLNDAAKTINTKYHRLHNKHGKPGIWDNLVNEIVSRFDAYIRAEERRRFEAEEAARRAAGEAAEAARRASEAESEAREAAAAGVCDVDLGGAIEEAQTTSQAALRAMWTAQRAEKDTKVRITGGSGNAMSLREHEILTVSDWRTAIEEMSGGGPIPQDIADVILKCARAHRKSTGDLPAGISQRFERSL